MEGVFVPVSNDLDLQDKLISPEIALWRYSKGAPHYRQGAPRGLAEADAARVEKALHETNLLGCVTVDRKRLARSHEAWVHVHINA